MRRRWLVWLWAFLTFGPLLGIALAVILSLLTGCELVYERVIPCTRLGVEWGALLNTLLFSGWLLVLTVPAGGFVALVVLGLQAYRQGRQPR